MKRNRYAAMTAVACAALADLARADAPTVAATAAGDNAAQLGSVTVTARRREESAQDVPLPVTTIGGDSLERSGAYRIETLQQSLPSTYIDFNNPRQVSIGVRGLGNNTVNEALEPDVGVYLDDVYLSRPGMVNFDLLDIDQVELVEGPQGTLYGKNTNAGVLKISTRAPTFTPESMAEFSGGSQGFYQARAMFSGPFGNEVAGRIAFSRTWQAGYIDDITDGRQLNGNERGGVRGQLLYKPSESFSLRLIGDYNYEHSNCCTPVPYSFGVPGPVTAGTTQYQLGAILAGAKTQPVLDPKYRTVTNEGPQHSDVRQGGASLLADWQLGAYKLSSITAYRTWAFYPQNDADFSSVYAVDNGENVDAKQFSQELRLASPSDRSVNYVAGLYYFFQNQTDDGIVNYGPQADAFILLKPPVDPAHALLNNAHVDVNATPTTDSLSGYAQASWKFAPRWELTGGLRETFEDKSSRVTMPTITGNPNTAVLQPAFDSGPQRIDDWNLSALLSLDYKATSNLMLYATGARGSKSGGINGNLPPYIITTPGPIPIGYYDTSSLLVSAEHAYDGELGFKSTGWNRRVMLNMDVYWTLAKDYQASLLEQTQPGRYSATLKNVGPVRAQGVEGQLEVLPVSGLKFNLTASYNDTLYRDYQDAPCPAAAVPPPGTPQPSCSLTSSQVNGAPRWNVNPELSYHHALADRFRGYVVTNYSWRSSFFGTADDSNLARVPAYGIANLRIGVSRPFGGSDWDLSGFATNLFDKHYVVGSISPAQFGAYFEYPGAPRIVGVSLRASF